MTSEKTAEQVGRSMVEILGTLAVMGVLTVSGIALFHSAMNRIQMNELKSWLTRMEMAFYETCYYKEDAPCEQEGGVKHAQSRNLLCNSTFGGTDFCSEETTPYVPSKIIPNIQWTTQATKDSWRIYFNNLTEPQCEQFFNMELPKNVVLVGTNNSSAIPTANPPTLTTAQKTYGISQCKKAASKPFILVYSFQ